MLQPGWGALSVRIGVPTVRVRVLSSTMVPRVRAVSSAAAERIRMPACAALPVPTMIDRGVASPRAQGQAMISTATRARVGAGFGVVGGRLHHVITDPELYFQPGRNPVAALYIWDGGLGIWGAVALGAVGAWIGCRRAGISLLEFADAMAPGLVLAQAVGRFGNYFNQELYGAPTTVAWALQIDPTDRPTDTPTIGLYHPTFLYEALWDVGVALLLVWVATGTPCGGAS